MTTARAVNRLFRRRAWLGRIALLTPATGWLVVIYIGSLVVLVLASFYKLDDFTFQPTSERTTENLRIAFTEWQFVWVVIRSVLIAAAVTAVCLVIALPSAFYIAKLAPASARRALIVSALLPLWAGYLVKGYAWKTIFRPGGISDDGGVLNSVLGFTPGFGKVAIIIALAYLWFPYMILPIYTGIERLPVSLLDASADLGGRSGRTFVSVIVPLLIPSIAAGSIFTFSLSMGDYLTPNIVTEGKVTMIGNLIYRTLLAPNQPLAAAYTLWPLIIIVVYLLGMRRMGAFRSL